MTLTRGAAAKGQDQIALSFCETMRGPFALGVTDPEEGRRRGQHEGTSLALRATVRIDAFDQFVNDANHAGTLTGIIDFDAPPFGQNMAGSKGLFNLFAPSGATAAKSPWFSFWHGAQAAGPVQQKHFIYELAFEYDGKPYYLAGRKDVRKGGELWGDTTTLYTRLHEGTDKKAKLVGAGVLSLGVNDLTDLLSTVEVHNASSDDERLAVKIRFGRLFLGELWDSYARITPGLP